MKPGSVERAIGGAAARAGAPADLSVLRIEREAPPPRGRRRLAGVLLLVLLLGGAYGAWKTWFSPPSVRTARVEVTGGAGPGGGIALTATGYVVARRTSTVGSKIAGRIETLHVEEGAVVRKGDVLAVLESSDLEARLAEALANLADAERELARVTRLEAGGAVGSAVVDGARTRLEVTRAQARVAEVDLENARILAPFDGTVIAKRAEVGETISFGVVSGQVSAGAIVVVADLRDLEVEADVNEPNLGRVVEGGPAEVVLDAFPEIRWRGVVRQIFPQAERATSTVPVRVSLLEPDARIRPDMSAKVFFGSDPAAPRVPPRLFVPEAAVEGDGEGAFVFVVREDRARKTRVRIGDRTTGKVEILAGLNGGERVIVSAPGGLEDGGRVRPAGGD